MNKTRKPLHATKLRNSGKPNMEGIAGQLEVEIEAYAAGKGDGILFATTRLEERQWLIEMLQSYMSNAPCWNMSAASWTYRHVTCLIHVQAAWRLYMYVFAGEI
eukprot:5141997-Amphidinium_carterae.1